MQAKQEKWDLYDQQGRKTGKTIQAGENVPYGYCLYCVGIWVIDSEKKILLTKRSSQKRYAPGKWENTGGHMISGETSRHAIVRELKEETGATAKKFIPLGKLYPSPGYCGEIIWMYAATGLSYGEQNPDDDEFLTVEKIPLGKAVELILSGEITDAKTQAAVLKLKVLKDHGKL